MSELQTIFSANAGGLSQCDKILLYLKSRRGVFVPMPEFVAASGSYVIHSRIADLRKRGHAIEQHNEWQDRQCHSSYCLN